MSVVIETTLGDITVDLFIEDSPMCCQNFLKLCQMKYYNLNKFHFVQKGFIAQTGDPTNTGKGGECVYALIKGTDPRMNRYIDARKKGIIKHDRVGLISMVNNGDGFHGSQFFFTLCSNLSYLDQVHTVFGEIVEGADVLAKINEAICDEHNRPYQDILITHTVVLHDPFPEIEGLDIPPKSPKVNYKELANSSRISIAEELLCDDEDAQEIVEQMKEKEARQRALVLEMIGDIPDADIKPPENVLFICKLNPVTREEDLATIFSKFGPIISCEIIKDEKTKKSLQYGFIEFKRKQDCETAFFKMDNVIIDDRRIHVDFSQSVSKIKWRGKGRGVTYLDAKDDEASLRYVRRLEKDIDERRHFRGPKERSSRFDRYEDLGHQRKKSRY